MSQSQRSVNAHERIFSEKMIQQDKVEHWAFGFTLSMFGVIDSWFVFNGLIFAIGKELYD